MIGIWLNWPGMWVTERGVVVEFETVADAEAWAQAEGLEFDAIEIKEID